MECSWWRYVSLDQMSRSQRHATDDYGKGSEERCYIAARTRVYD